jgi:hypothetical protein
MKDPPEQRHRKRLDRPVDEQRDADAAPVLAHLMQRAEVHLHQHRDDHDPDQDAHGHIHPRHIHPSDRLGRARKQLAQRDAGDDAQEHPDGEIGESVVVFMPAAVRAVVAERRKPPA